MVCDFTCSDTLAPSYIKSSSKEAGKIASEKEDNKIRKYQSLVDQFDVIPVCVETMGPWGPNGKKLVQEIGKKVHAETGEPRSTSFLFQAISIAVKRGNRASILGTLEKIWYFSKAW